MESRVSFSSRWATAFCQPFVSDDTRLRAKREFEALCVADPGWCRWWLSGAVSNVACSLPVDDPWTGLGARVLGDGVDIVRPGLAHTVPDGTGAVLPDGDVFGGPSSVTDLVVPETDDFRQDLFLAPYAEKLSGEAAALVGFSMGGAASVHQAVLALEAVTGGPVFDALIQALRLVSTRRARYEGADDVFTMLSLLWWQDRAGRLLLDPGSPQWDEEVRREIENAKIPEGAWEFLAQ